MLGLYKWDNWIDRILLRLKYPRVIFYPSEGDDSWWRLGKGLNLMPYCIIYSNVCIGDFTLVAPFAQIRERSFVGRDCKIGAKCNIEWEVSIGDRCKIQGLTMVAEKTIIMNDVFIAMGVNMMTDNYMDGASLKPITICNGAKIGGGVSILPGTVIEADATIGAGCVVKGTIPEGAKFYARAVLGEVRA